MQRRKPVTVLQDDEGGGLWMTSYADLISAVLAVLVMFVSFSRIDLEKMDSVQRLLSRDQECPTLIKLRGDIRKSTETGGVADQVNLTLDRDGLTISYDSAAIFRSGSAELDQRLLAPFRDVMKIVADAGHYRHIDIAGHTDDLPVRSGSNWQLSSDRALAMFTYLKQRGLPAPGTRLAAFADTRPKVAITGLSGAALEDARRNNRRVDITIRHLKADAMCGGSD